MKDFSANTFTSNGKKFTFAVCLMVNGEEQPIELDNNTIQEFEYESEFNGLVHYGSVTYVDECGKIDRCIDTYNTICQVQLILNEQQFDGSMTVEHLSEIDKFIGVFVVNSILILKRESTRITYKINLVSSNVYKCLANISYSNYGSQSKSCFDIIKDCAAQSQLAVDNETFNSVQTNVRLDYITNGNDNFFTVVKYVMSKLYYNRQSDDSMKFIFYDELRSAYRLFDVKNVSKTTTGTRQICLSMTKSGAESLIQAQQPSVGSVTKFSQVDVINTFSEKYVHIYDYSTNEFSSHTVGAQALQQYFNARSDAQQTVCRSKDFSIQEINVGVHQNSPEWNNDSNVYNEVTRCLFKNNALLIQTFGEIQCIPGCMVTIQIDREQDNTELQDPDQLEEQTKRYLSYEGVWYVARVHSSIQPMSGQDWKYKQVLTLVRNFTYTAGTSN